MHRLFTRPACVLPIVALVLLSVGWYAVPAPAVPGDEFWSADFYRSGIHGFVNAMVGHDGVLVVGGELVAAGGLAVRNIATWDGVSWGTLGSGVDGEVTSLVVFGDDLVAAGQFSEAGGVAAANIARWDGVGWHPLGPGADGRVSNLVVYNGQLIALGDFTSAAGPAAAKVAAWDGVSWVPLGAGPDLESFAELYTAVVFDGRLLIGGWTGWAPVPLVWDGVAWSEPYPSPGNMPINDSSLLGSLGALGVYSGELIAGGIFRYYDADSGERYSSIARWNGTRWVGLGEGVSAPTPVMYDIPFVTALAVHEGSLIVGGRFWIVDDTWPVNGVARWDGSSWHEMDYGLTDYDGNDYYSIPVRTLAVWNGQLFAGGEFQAAGLGQSREVRNLAMWDVDRWETIGPWGLGLSGALRVVMPHDGEILVGGSWYDINGAAQRLARHSPDGWIPFGTPLNGEVRALAELNGRLVAGGAFTQAGGQPAQHVALWDGAAWQSIGDGLPDVVSALAVHDGDLYAGPHRWSGSAWVDELQTNGAVLALQVWQGHLYAGGAFSTARGVAAAGIVGWDGQACFPLGSGLTYYPSGTPRSAYCLSVYDGDLIAGGNFNQAGTAHAVYVARWDGGGWSAVGDGLTSTGSESGVYSLATFGTHLIAGGRFLHESVPLNFIGRWDGSAWHALGSGVQPNIAGNNVCALLVNDLTLWVGGTFQLAGGTSAFSVCSWADPAVLVDPTGIADASPAAPSRLAVAPNPFNPSATIRFMLTAPCPVRLTIHDLKGRRLATLTDALWPEGVHVLTWTGRDDHGRDLPSGAYVARLSLGRDTETQRLTLVR